MQLHLVRALVFVSAGLGLACDGEGSMRGAGPGASPGAGGKADDQDAMAEDLEPADLHQERMLECVDRLLQAQTDDDFNDALIPAYSCLEGLNNRVVHEYDVLVDFAAEADDFRDSETYLMTRLNPVWDQWALEHDRSIEPRMDYVWSIRDEVDFAAWVAQTLADDGEASDEFVNEWWGDDGRTVPNSLQPCLAHLDDTFYPQSNADSCIDEIAESWGDQLRVFVLGTGMDVDPSPSDLVAETEAKLAAMCEAATSDELSECKIQLRISLWSRVGEFLSMVDVLQGEIPT